MKNESQKIRSFTDLYAWQESHKLVVATYELTKSLPAREAYGLCSQMQRAAVSITSNIAEGFSRGTFADKKHFYMMAKGSLTELQNQLLVARDVGYVSGEDFSGIANQPKTALGLLAGLIRSTAEHDRRKYD